MSQFLIPTVSVGERTNERTPAQVFNHYSRRLFNGPCVAPIASFNHVLGNARISHSFVIKTSNGQTKKSAYDHVMFNKQMFQTMFKNMNTIVVFNTKL